MIDNAMLWQMQVTSPRHKEGQSTLTRPLAEEIEAAIAHYTATRQQTPDLCLVNPRHDPKVTSVNGCAVRATRSATPFCLVVGMAARSQNTRRTPT